MPPFQAGQRLLTAGRLNTELSQHSPDFKAGQKLAAQDLDTLDASTNFVAGTKLRAEQLQELADTP